MKLSNVNKPVHDEGIKAIMNISELETISHLENFLDGTQAVIFSIDRNQDERYAWIQKTLLKFKYVSLGKYEKGVVTQYVLKVTGYSRQQFTRLVSQYRKRGYIQKRNKIKSTSFKKHYTPADIRLLARLDERHGTLCGPTTKKLCERAYHCFKQMEYERLSGISASHIYNLRKSIGYKRQRWTHDNTKPKASTIGERRKPRSDGNPGYIRIDTVHQGDLDGQKGVYHINAVDEVTQFEIVCSIERISEQFLIPVLEDQLNAFPFEILGFHSDNGSEYINKDVVRLLKKLHVEFTKSRPRKSNDNALAECKNGAIVRKILGYMHIPQQFAEAMNEFNRKYLNPYINYHRPCFFPEMKTDKKGKERKVYDYDAMMTPYEKFKSLEKAHKYLREGLTFEELDKLAMQINDDEAAKRMQQARSKLFQNIDGAKKAAS